MKAHDLRQMEIADLEAKVSALREDIFKMRFQHATAQLGDPSSLTKVRRTLARAMTVLAERTQEATNTSEA